MPAIFSLPRQTRTVGIIFTLSLLGACSAYTLSEGPRAVATISPTSVAGAAGMNPQGSVRFVQQGDSISVSGRISGLKPNAEHGFHIHEASDCSGDGLATKGHFNPDGSPHGRHGGPSHHAGDMPSLKTDAGGVAEFKFSIKKLTVSAGPASIVGRGIIVHRDPDDYTTQPTGNAGPRPGCGVIRAES